MRTLAVILVFIFSLVGVIDTVSAEAHSRVRIESGGISAPVALDDPGSAISANDKDKKKKKKKKQDDKDEEDEEDYRSYDSGAALNLVDPGAFEFVVRMSAQASYR